jgi:hypothetical protein
MTVKLSVLEIDTLISSTIVINSTINYEGVCMICVNPSFIICFVDSNTAATSFSYG